MGIKGLWKEVNDATTKDHLHSFKGMKLAVDGYGWMHKAVIPSAIPLATGQPCDRYLRYFISRLNLLMKYGITPYVVFDGRSMPMKSDTDKQRGEARANAKQEGLRLLKLNRRNEAQTMLEKAISITPEMVYAVCSLIRKIMGNQDGEKHPNGVKPGVKLYIAAYESDPQLVYLCREGIVQGVISEDSDLLVYGCPLLISKLDFTGACDVTKYVGIKRLQSLKHLFIDNAYNVQTMDIDLKGYCSNTREYLNRYKNFDFYFILTCIFSGCDYAASLPGVGIKKSIKIVSAIQQLNLHFVSIPLLLQVLYNRRDMKPMQVGINQVDDQSKIYLEKLTNLIDRMVTKLQEFVSIEKGDIEVYLVKVFEALYSFSFHYIYNPITKVITHMQYKQSAITNQESIIGENYNLSNDNSLDNNAVEVCERIRINPRTNERYMETEIPSVQLYIRKHMSLNSPSDQPFGSSQQTLHQSNFQISKVPTMRTHNAKENQVDSWTKKRHNEDLCLTYSKYFRGNTTDPGSPVTIKQSTVQCSQSSFYVNDDYITTSQVNMPNTQPTSEVRSQTLHPSKKDRNARTPSSDSELFTSSIAKRSVFNANSHLKFMEHYK